MVGLVVKSDICTNMVFTVTMKTLVLIDEIFSRLGVGGPWLFLVYIKGDWVTTVIRNGSDFVDRAGALHFIFNNVIYDPFIGFVSRGELAENLMG